MTKYKLSAQVKRVMTQAAIDESDLDIMVSRAAIVTHSEGNRRYHSWLMQVEGDKVVRLRKLELTSIGHGKSPMEEECIDCEGRGCVHCGWAGKVRRWI